MNIHLHPLIILFGGELIVLLLVATVVFFIKMRKYKKLYHNLQNQVQDYKPLPTDLSADKIQQEMVETEQEIETKNEVSATDISQETPVEMDTTIPEETDIEDKGDVPPSEQESVSEDNISKLKNIIEFQRQKIVDLMCYKDILESAEKRLTNIHNGYQDLSNKFATISEAMQENKEFELTLEMFGENTGELKDFISTLHKENETLLEKFNVWQEQLKSAWQESDSIEAVSGDIESVLREKEEMSEKLKEFEQKLNQKTKQLQEAQTRYEDLENEYMTLYRQQHGK